MQILAENFPVSYRYGIFLQDYDEPTHGMPRLSDMVSLLSDMVSLILTIS